MRRETPETTCSACYGAGTRVEVHRSRHELERVLSKYGAHEVLVVEADANAAIQFALHGRYVQLALPLPDPQDARFTYTPSGKVRTAAARERAYDQALREHWRSLIVAVRGKLQSVESGISTFEQEFDPFLVSHLAVETQKRSRRAPKAVNWLLGGSHSLAIALVTAFLVPASAVGAFALPANVVGRLATPLRATTVDESASTDADVALARGAWTPSSGDAGASSPDGRRLLALRTELLGSADEQSRQEAALSSPPSEPQDVPPPQAAPATASPTSLQQPDSPAPSSQPADAGPGPDTGRSATPPPAEPPAAPPADTGDTSQPSDAGAAPDTTTQADPPADTSSSETMPPADGSSSVLPTDGSPDTGVPPAVDPTTSPGNGNGNGQGNGQGQGNGNGNANGQGNGQGQGTGQGQGNGQGNGKGKGGK